MSQLMSGKLYEIMNARGISILGVLAIHVTSTAVVELPVGNVMHFIYLVLNKAANFSVPSFVFLSGLVLFYRYREFVSYRQVLAFYSKRSMLIGLLCSGILIQIIVGFINDRLNLVSDKSILCSTYILAFLLGGYIGYYYKESVIWINSRKNYLLASACIFLIIHIILSSLGAYHWQINAFIRESVVQCFCIIVAISLIGIGKIICDHGARNKLIQNYGSNSFGIYLAHPLFLALCTKYINFPVESSLFHLNIVVKAMVAVVLPLMFVIGIKKWKYCWCILGKV